MSGGVMGEGWEDSKSVGYFDRGEGFSRLGEGDW